MGALVRVSFLGGCAQLSGVAACAAASPGCTRSRHGPTGPGPSPDASRDTRTSYTSPEPRGRAATSRPSRPLVRALKPAAGPSTPALNVHRGAGRCSPLPSPGALWSSTDTQQRASAPAGSVCAGGSSPAMAEEPPARSRPDSPEPPALRRHNLLGERRDRAGQVGRERRGRGCPRGPGGASGPAPSRCAPAGPVPAAQAAGAGPAAPGGGGGGGGRWVASVARPGDPQPRTVTSRSRCRDSCPCRAKIHGASHISWSSAIKCHKYIKYHSKYHLQKRVAWSCLTGSMEQ